MIITKLRIKNFGKLKELEIQLGEKLNIIYGTNEAGKSTVLAFLKAMLYGMNSQKKALRDNDRLRFQPWDGDFGEGELYFREEQGRELILRRKLGSRRGDNWTILDALTGRPVAEYHSAANPGEVMLGLGEAAYSRTIYIPQLGCAVLPDKEDEIMARLMNLHQTGEEQVSLHKALNDLEKERKKLTIRSGNGKLDALRNLQTDLLNERKIAEQLYEENRAEQAELNHLHEEKSRLQDAYGQLEKQKLSLKRYKQYLEYIDLQKEADTLQQWQHELAAIDEQLMCGSYQVDSAFLAESEAKLTEYQQKANLVFEQQEEIKAKEVQLNSQGERLAAFQGFGDLPEDVESQLLRQEQQEKRCTDALERVKKHYQEIENLQRDTEAQKTELGLMVNFYDLTASQEKDLAGKEEYKRQLEERIKHDRQIDTLRRDFITDKVKKAKNGVISGAGLFLAGILLGIFVHPLCYLLVLFGLVAGFCAFLQGKKNKETLAEIDAQLASNDSLLRDYHGIVAELEEFYHRFGAMDNQDYLAKRRTFTAIDGEIEVLKAKIADREEQVALEREEEVRKQLEKSREYIAAILKVTQCNSIQEFSERLTEFREISRRRDEQKRNLNALKEKLNKLFASRTEVTQYLASRFGFEKVEEENIDQIAGLIQKFKDDIAEKNALTIRSASETKNLERRLAGRDLASLATSLEGYSPQEMAPSGICEVDNELDKVAEEEEKLEKKIKDFSEERLNIEKQITGKETALQNRMQQVREPARIEEELAEVAEQIKKYEEIVEVLDFTRVLLQQSFQELQSSFGPILNGKVGQILQGITAGRYADVKVAENYQISLKDQLEMIRDVQFYSNGTLDQVYFALRLAIIDLAYNRERRLPLLLDDAFVQYDDGRLAATLNYLLGFAEQHQVLLFSCHRREGEILAGQDFHYLTI